MAVLTASTGNYWPRSNDEIRMTKPERMTKDEIRRSAPSSHALRHSSFGFPSDFVIRASSFLSSHRAHDYAFLIKRWRAVAGRAGLLMRPFAAESGFRVYCIRSKRLPREGAIYLSAGIHGDEPAGTEALIAWAERNARTLAEFPFLILPCLNPWGLVHNSRRDESGRDLNRCFHHDETPLIASFKSLVRPHRFALALMLHEDYDGQGVYIYEIDNVTPFWGEDLLNAARPLLPIEGRTVIEGRESRGGIVRRKIKLRMFK